MTTPSEERPLNLKALLVLSLAHLVADVYQGALPAILPFLKERLSLSYSMAGVIMLASNLTSSVVQPLFGLLSDREEKPLLLPAGCLIAGIGFAFLPLAPNYASVLVLVIISGLGVAAYHPEGFKTAYYFTGRKAATGMSVFSFGGNLGFALGPIIGLFLITRMGFSSLSFMIVLALIAVAALAYSWNTLTARKLPASPKAVGGQTPFGIPIPLVILLITVVLRSWIHVGLMTYIPFYYIDVLRGDPVYAGKLVSSFLLGGVVGTVLGAPLADRWGHKKYLLISLSLSTVIFPLILRAQGMALLVALWVFGMVLISTFTVTIVMAQRILPERLGIVSGLTVGFAIGTGGIGVTILGVIADNYGVLTALRSISILPVAALILSFFVKYSRS